MGRDIHLFVEYQEKQFDDGQWTYLAEFECARWISLFAVLGAGKPEEPATIPLKGIPEDLSFALGFKWNKVKGDAHHVSWLTSEESMRIALKPHCNVPEWSGIVACMQAVERKTVKPTRLIYWFDN